MVCNYFATWFTHSRPSDYPTNIQRRLFKGVFEIRPALPKYNAIWDVDVGKLLEYLNLRNPTTHLSLMDLTCKTTSLLYLLTGQRCQPMHSINLSGIQSLPDLFCITILQPCKTSKLGIHIILLECIHLLYQTFVSFHISWNTLNEQQYILIGSPTKLFSSYQKPHSTVSLLIRHNICMSKINHEIGWHTYMWFYPSLQICLDFSS